MEAFEIRNLSFTYPSSEKKALDNINLNIEKGDFFVLLGISGSGKSTLLRQLKPSFAPNGSKSGEILFENKNIISLNAKESTAKIGFVLQSPESQVVTDKVWHELAFGLESLSIDTPEIRKRTAETAAFFGIENWYYKNVSELSGGQKQLLSLASVTAMQPEVIILDEPTAQLDPIASSEFMGALCKINRELGTTVILSEHRLEDALSFATKAAVMNDGRITATGTVEEVAEILKKEKSGLFCSMPAATRIWGGVESDLCPPVTVNEGRAFVEKYLIDKPVNHLKKQTSTEEEKETAVKIEEAFFAYEKGTPDIVKNLNLTAYFGENLCILGGNGAGKSTTLKLISGIKHAYRGEVKTYGKVALLPQNPQSVFVKKTVFEDLESVLISRKIPKYSIENEIKKVSALCGITSLLKRHPYDLSGGEQQKAALAKVLLTNPQILLLDEPTKGLDILFKRNFSDIIKKLKNKGVCIITVSHDVEFCAEYADRCALFFDGGIVSEANPQAFFSRNCFYTTPANRIIRNIEPLAVTSEDVIEVLGGKVSRPEKTNEKVPEFINPEKQKKQKEALPAWRKICAAISGVMALILLIYCAKTEVLSELVGSFGTTKLGYKQLLIYGIFIFLTVLCALFIGKREKKIKQTEPGKRSLSKRTTFSTAIVLALVPVTLFFSVFYLGTKQYYITAIIIVFECMLPFFIAFEGKKPKAREITVIATFCAMAIASRAAFFMLPQFKPVMAIAIIAGVAFGGEAGFLVGAVSILVSNLMFGQGPWTPFQMFAMGLTGFLAGVLYKKGVLVRSRIALCIFGSLSAIIIYGGLLNPVSALLWGRENLSIQIIAAYYISGFPMDCVHAASTAIFLWFAAEPCFEKTDRIKEKYGLLDFR